MFSLKKYTVSNSISEDKYCTLGSKSTVKYYNRNVIALAILKKQKLQYPSK